MGRGRKAPGRGGGGGGKRRQKKLTGTYLIVCQSVEASRKLIRRGSPLPPCGGGTALCRQENAGYLESDVRGLLDLGFLGTCLKAL